MLLEAITGNETFSDTAQSFNINCNYRRNITAPQIGLFAGIRDSNSGVRAIGGMDRLQASQRSEKHGLWLQGRFDIPPESLLFLHIQRRQTTPIYQNLRLVLRMREEAALQQLRIPFTGHENATMVCGYYEGRFDIIPPTWFDDMGLALTMLNQYDLSNLADWLHVEEKEPEISAYRPTLKVRMTTASGNNVVLPRGSIGRKLTLRPKNGAK